MLVQQIKNTVNTHQLTQKDALVTDDHSLTYGELLDKVDTLSDALGKLGVGAGDLLIAYIENVPAFLILQLACNNIGAVFASFDYGSSSAEMDYRIQLTRPKAIVALPDDSQLCADLFPNLIQLDPLGTLIHHSIDNTNYDKTSYDKTIGLIQFSSGSTSAAKAILLSFEALNARASEPCHQLGLTTSDRTLCTLPLTHTHGLECLAIPTLYFGGTLYLKSPKFSYPLYIIEELARLKITFFSSIPTFYDFAVKLESGAYDLSHLRHPLCGSAPLSLSTATTFFEKFGVRLKQGYGLSELSVICLNNHADGTIVYDSVGQPVYGVEHRILGEQDDDGRLRGELVVRSKQTFSGYLNNPEATKERLQDGWLHTGDIVTEDSHGRLRIVGRLEDFIKVKGFKVYTAEIEKVLIGCPLVKECAVVSEQDQHNAERIAAHIVPMTATSSDPQDSKHVKKTILDYLRSQLSDYKIPQTITLHTELPKSAMGKILKSRISG